VAGKKGKGGSAWRCPAEIAARVARLRAAMERERLSAFLVTDASNVRYLTGFTGDESALLISRRKKMLITDFRYAEESAETALGCEVFVRNGNMMQAAADLIRRLRTRRVGVERRRMTIAEHALLGRRRSAGMRIVPTDGIIEHLRRKKSAREVAAIRKCIRVAERALREVLRHLRPGMRETEFAAELDYRMRLGGAQGPAFATIVAFGARAAFPHAQPSRASRLREGQLVLVDWGARVDFYNCDLTRTFAVGTISKRLAELHRTVREAQSAAIQVTRSGALLREVDRAAREAFKRAGRAAAFGHGTGHGVGLDVHEEPAVSRRSRGEVGLRAVIAIEPGLYFPGECGIRIEDDVCVGAGGAEVLSTFPRGAEI